MEVESILLDFQAAIKSELFNLIKQDTCNIVHTHPPVTYIVTGCPYCEKYGNVFSSKLITQ